MKSTTSSFQNVQSPTATETPLGANVSVTETPIVGKSNARRMTTTSKNADGQINSILIEEFHNDRLSSRLLELHRPSRSTTRELYEADGTLISSETERCDSSGLQTKIVIRGAGKSSTTRILCGEVEARGTERSVLIETPRASYSYQPFDGKWSSFYKDISMKLELKANFLKSPDAILNGPDGIKLVFKAGRLVDMLVCQPPSSMLIDASPDCDNAIIPSIID